MMRVTRDPIEVKSQGHNDTILNTEAKGNTQNTQVIFITVYQAQNKLILRSHHIELVQNHIILVVCH